MEEKDKYKMNNIVRIGSRDKRELYIYAILLRMAPAVYDLKGHQCVVLQVRDSLLEFTETIIRKFKWAGLEEVSRKRKELPNEKEGYTLPEAWEIILRKIPVLEMMQEED